MFKYAKVVNHETGICEVALSDNIDFYKSIGMTGLDVEISDIDGQWYLAELCPHKTDEQKLQEAKEQKIIENDTARDEALNQGVTYKDVLFDSDTDQKVNLLAMVSTMTGEETMYWYGKNNTPLLCAKEDLINIGGLITQLHAFCWNKNAEIKQAIAEAQTIEEVNEIDTHYILPLETESEETNED